MSEASAAWACILCSERVVECGHSRPCELEEGCSFVAPPALLSRAAVIFGALVAALTEKSLSTWSCSAILFLLFFLIDIRYCKIPCLHHIGLNRSKHTSKNKVLMQVVCWLICRGNTTTLFFQFSFVTFIGLLVDPKNLCTHSGRQIFVCCCQPCKFACSQHVQVISDKCTTWRPVYGSLSEKSKYWFVWWFRSFNLTLCAMVTWPCQKHCDKLASGGEVVRATWNTDLI